MAFEQSPDIEVIACAGNGMEALLLCEKLAPDLVLMDIAMPDCDGIEGTRLIKEKYNNIKVIILTTFIDEEKISQAIKNGADGYVLKDISTAELITTIKNSFANLRVIHQNVLDMLKNQFKKEDNDILVYNFTDQEKTIIKMIVNGRNNKEIASVVHLSEGRVRNIVTEILNKLKLESRTQLAVYAIKHKLI